MTLDSYLRILRKRWLTIAICVLLSVGAAAGVVIHATPTYRASAQLFVAAKDGSSDLGGLAQGGQFTQQRVQSYADIINSPQVTDPVAATLRDGLSGSQISNEVSATAPLNTVLVNVSVTDSSARRAQSIANAVSAQFATFATQLEKTPGSTTSPVKVTVVKRAQLPTAPVSPSTDLDLALGLLVGLALGIGFAVIRDAFDNTVKNAGDIATATASGTIGSIPYDTDAKSHPLVVSRGAHHTRSESFRQLRTNLQFIDVDSAPRSIVFTSSVPDEGKSTTVCNLAITLAQAGKKVLLVEADLRRPRASSYLGLVDAVGLTSVLVGSISLEDATQHWGQLPLYLLPAGPTPPNPSELLASHGMGALLKRMTDTYDFVLLDSPPLLPVTDAAVLASQADGAVIVVRYGRTKREQLKRSVDALASVNARLLGCVINMTPPRGPDAYSYGYNYAPRVKLQVAADEKPKPAEPPAAPRTSTVDVLPEPKPAGPAATPTTRPATAERRPDPTRRVEQNASGNGNGPVPTPGAPTAPSAPEAAVNTPAAAAAIDESQYQLRPLPAVSAEPGGLAAIAIRNVRDIEDRIVRDAGNQAAQDASDYPAS